ncbi:MAG: hypothetical protein AB8U30_02460 [Rickettsiales endosymbiont of Dermacentor nuttalli]
MQSEQIDPLTLIQTIINASLYTQILIQDTAQNVHTYINSIMQQLIQAL